jgi:hypothetical protein
MQDQDRSAVKSRATWLVVVRVQFCHILKKMRTQPETETETETEVQCSGSQLVHIHAKANADCEQNFGYMNSFFFPPQEFLNRKKKRQANEATRCYVPVLFLAGCV